MYLFKLEFLAFPDIRPGVGLLDHMVTLYLGINLPKEAKDPYSENYKTLMTKLKMTQTDGKMYCVLGLEQSILFK